MEIKPEELLFKLQRGEPFAAMGNLLAVYGEEDYYRGQIAAAVPAFVFAGVEESDREITVFDKDTDLRQLASVINTYPFFCGRSLVILKDEKLWGGKQDSDSRKQQLDRLAELLSDIPEYCTVLICASKLDKRTKLFKLLKKQALLCECASLRPYDLAPWLERQAEQYGARWEREAIGTVLEYLAPVERAPLQLLQQEVAKLAVYAGARKTWTKSDVDEIFSALPEASGFALLNAICDRRLGDALRLLADERKKGGNILPVCALVMFKLRQMLQFMELRQHGYDLKGATAELKLHPYAAKKMQEQCRRFEPEALRQALAEITQLNIDLRRGGRGYARLEEILLCLIG